MVAQEDLRVPPTLQDGETVQVVVPGRHDSLIWADVGILVTDRRIVVSPLRGRSVSGFEGEHGNVSIPFEEVAICRRHGLRRHRIELVLEGGRIYELPSLERADAAEIVETISSAGDLERTAYGDPESSRSPTRTVFGAAAVVLGVAGLLLGLSLVVIGIGLMLTFVGVFLGLFLVLLGGLLGWGSAVAGRRVTLWAFGERAEWREPAGEAATSGQETVPEATEG